MEEKETFCKSGSARWIITLILYVVVFGGIAFCEAFMPSGLELLAIIPIGVFTFFGWKALNRIQPSMFLWMSWAGWFVYVFVKVILSALIGLFVTPWILAKNITNHFM